jgi:hypothetical protein
VSDAPGVRTFVVVVFVRGSVTTKVTGRSPPVLASVIEISPSPFEQVLAAETDAMPGRSQATVTVWS